MVKLIIVHSILESAGDVKEGVKSEVDLLTSGLLEYNIPVYGKAEQTIYDQAWSG